MLPLPIDQLSLEEKYQIIKLLQNRGANIQELNTVRQAMSQLKNGGLARIAKANTVRRKGDSFAQLIFSFEKDCCIDPLGCYWRSFGIHRFWSDIL